MLWTITIGCLLLAGLIFRQVFRREDEQEVAGEVGAAAEGIGEEGDAKAAAQRADGAFARAFAPAHDDQDGRSYGGGGAQGGTGGRQA